MDAPEPAKKNHKKRNLAFLITGLVFVLCVVAFLVYYLIWGQFSETTSDTYVSGNMIVLTPQVEGIVTTIYVDNALLVEEGDPILEIDRHNYEIAFEKSKAGLANTVRTVVQLFLRVEELSASLASKAAVLAQAELDFKHRSALVEDGSVSREEFERSENDLLSQRALLIEIQKQLESAKSEVEGTQVRSHPLVEAAKAVVAKAFLDLHRCTLLSPTRGIITQRRAQIGQYVNANDPLMALVPLDEIWVDANFREVQLKNFRLNQSVELTSDMYGGDVTYHGKLVGLNPGTGSVFSILPPQNATGNWIKIVQRVPVKISLQADEIKEHPLVLGLSMTATVDTHDRDGLRLPDTSGAKVRYQTSVYADELEGLDLLLQTIVDENSPL